MFNTVYGEAFEHAPSALREDFCGTFLIGCEWVKQGPERRAIVLDIDPEPLRYGRRVHLSRLAPAARRRVEVRRCDVRSITSPRVHLICAMNFSFYAFKRSEDLLRYFQACYHSLGPRGVLIVDVVGGPAFHRAPHCEQRSYRYTRGVKADYPWFTYFWHHKHFDSRRREGVYAIDFKPADGPRYRDVFIYDWRVWSLPEIRAAMHRAGFETALTYTQSDADGCCRRIGRDPRDECWICYVAGLKRTAGISRNSCL